MTSIKNSTKLPPLFHKKERVKKLKRLNIRCGRPPGKHAGLAFCSFMPFSDSVAKGVGNSLYLL